MDTAQPSSDNRSSLSKTLGAKFRGDQRPLHQVQGSQPRERHHGAVGSVQLQVTLRLQSYQDTRGPF